jgi:hypothetical protein
LDDRRISIADHRADPVCRIPDTDVGVAPSLGAADWTADVLSLTVDDDLLSGSRR